MATNFTSLLQRLVENNAIPRNQFGTEGFRPSFPGFELPRVQSNQGPGEAFLRGISAAEAARALRAITDRQIAPIRPDTESEGPTGEETPDSFVGPTGSLGNAFGSKQANIGGRVGGLLGGLPGGVLGTIAGMAAAVAAAGGFGGSDEPTEMQAASGFGPGGADIGQAAAAHADFGEVEPHGAFDFDELSPHPGVVGTAQDFADSNLGATLGSGAQGVAGADEGRGAIGEDPDDVSPGSGSESESGGDDCYVSTALADTGAWSPSQKRKAVMWCLNTHHDGSVRGGMWVDGYHQWGRIVARLARKSPVFRKLVRSGSSAFMRQATGDRNLAGMFWMYCWAQPLSYAIGFMRWLKTR